MKKIIVDKTHSKLILNKNYQPAEIEQSLYEFWEKNGYFIPNDNKKQESFCIVMPPPNITGNLHMGHAFQQTIMDILIRYQRMQGKNTLWQGGTDHAGIATQMIVERKIAIEENKTRYDYGRKAFIDKIWQWKSKLSKNISQQMRRLGNSIDWQRERFTMDEGLSKTVKEAFIQLYQDNLIYRGKRLVNWDPKLHTAISDLEVENRKINSFIWYFRYPLANNVKTVENQNYIIVTTTRPETIFADTGVAVNPIDLRYKNLIGKQILLPLSNRYIPIIGDKHVDMQKGTGCIKITPAHDFNDYKIGKRHQLPMISIFDFNGRIRQKAEVFDNNEKSNAIYTVKIPKLYHGIERFVAREIVIKELENLGLLVTKKPCQLTVPYGDRSGVIIEPMLTNQWYVSTKPLAEEAIVAVKKGRIQFIPKQYENMYFSWMQNIQDWCISRQLWWGHRIPVWYDKVGTVYVGRDENEIRRINNIDTNTHLHQDEDVLDTWFSSGLWTFSTLGWLENDKTLKTFHPTNVLVSGFDIIFFWISRMIMLTMYFIKDKNGQGQIPFKTVYITGLIRDEKGEKMSKSKGNVIDPLDLIDGISLKDLLKKRTTNMIQPQLAEKIIKSTCKSYPQGIKAHGADALRFTFAALASTGRDINWDMKRLTGYHNFCNKLWNASRYVLINTEGKDYGQYGGKIIFSLADKWIMAEFNQTVKLYREALDSYRFDIATNILYKFIWSQFCDWYLEISKSIIHKGNEAEIRGTRYTLIETLENLLKLAHPIIPFITETIWQNIKIIKNIQQDTIMLQSFPTFEAKKIDETACHDLLWIKELISAIRSIRAEINISPTRLLDLVLLSTKQEIKQCVIKNLNFIRTIGRLNSVSILDKSQQKPFAITKLINGAEILIPMTDLIDKNTELARLNKELNKLTKKITIIENKLSNNNFINRAPSIIINKERERLEIYLLAKQKITKQKITISSL